MGKIKSHFLTLIVSILIIMLMASPVSGCAEIFTWTENSNTKFDGNIKIVKAGDSIFATNGEDMMQLVDDDWVKIDTDIHPDDRSYFSLTYDETNDKIILFGGWDDSAERVFDDLWSFDVTTKIWTEITDSDKPLGVRDGYMVDIPDRNRTVSFSGTNSQGASNFFGTFDYTTSNWDHIVPDSYAPLTRWGHSMVYVESTGSLFLIGGSTWVNNEWEYRNDVHMYNFTSNEWTLLILNGESAMPPRARFAAQYDPVHDVILVQGGMHKTDSYGDTWTYDIANNEWNELILEDELIAIGHNMILVDNTFHIIEARNYILDDLALDALYTRNDDRADSISDYDREVCLQTNFFDEFLDLDTNSASFILTVILAPIIFFIAFWIKVVQRMRKKETPKYEIEESGYNKF